MKSLFIEIWNQLFNVRHITHIIKTELNSRPAIRICCVNNATNTPNERYYSNKEIRDAEYDKLVKMLQEYEY